MSSEKERSNVSESENLCVVCCNPMEIYSIGICNHCVCFECSTRMRVLCDQKECPICRGQMPKVIFTEETGDYGDLLVQHGHTPFQDRKYGLIFSSEHVKNAYKQLMEHRCDICTKLGGSNRRSTFYTFQQMKDHMRREHNAYACDICVENLKIFSFERRFYTKQELGYHRRKGDPDDTSHRGHPLCEFCDTRFMDSDELFRHLRRNHHYCYFCDADGKHQYYSSMEDLRNHFRDEHYLCDEGDCINCPLTAVFRSQIDLKAHIATEHSRSLSKSANKQARTLELEFTLAPRPGTNNKRHNNARPTHVEEPSSSAAAYFDDSHPSASAKKEINPQDFPALGNTANRPGTSVNFVSKVKSFTGNDFPSLGRGRAAPAITVTANASNSRKKAPEVTITRTMRGASAQNLTKNAENFPSLGKAPPGTSTLHLSLNNGQNTAPKVSIHVNHNHGVTTTHITSNSTPSEAFPALAGSSAPKNVQWVQQKPKKAVESRIKKVAPPPQLPPSDLSQFPSLNRTKPAPKKAGSNNNNASKAPEAKKGDKNRNNNNLDGVDDASGVNRNGIVKKRSELRIGELSVSETVRKGAPTPPGIAVKPPPGFAANLTAPNFPANDLTFTNSTGQSYAITKSSDYHQPTGFTHRNQNLIKRLMGLLNAEMIPEFKTHSNHFRNGQLPANEYYAYCEAVLGDVFGDLFPELLVLLPDVDKQQELYKQCNEEVRTNLLVCENCRQIVFRKELSEHWTFHTLESQFPSLGKATETTNNVWKK